MESGHLRVTSLEKALAIVDAALGKKAYDLVLLDVEHLRSIADYFVITTGRSDVQVQSIARGIEEHMARQGKRPHAVEGFNHGYWVVMDYDDVVVHIFFEPARELYRLETNWIDARRIALPEPYSSIAQDLRLSVAG